MTATPPAETILLVEDDPPLRTLIRTILEKDGYYVIEARNGAEAADVAHEHRTPIDLVLTDVVMPHVDGFELVERLRHVHPETGVFVHDRRATQSARSRRAQGIGTRVSL